MYIITVYIPIQLEALYTKQSIICLFTCVPIPTESFRLRQFAWNDVKAPVPLYYKDGYVKS